MRQIIEVSGPDAADFLQGLVTNNVTRAPVYAALLTPQGKYLADFFVVPAGEGFLLDAEADQAPALMQRLSMYKLRSKVDLVMSDMPVARGTGTAPEDAIPDPRHSGLGWRLYGATGDDGSDWQALRVTHCVPQAGIELIPNETYILEAGFERLNGVDFRKGCYVGQEVTARMKHKTTLRKGLRRVAVQGAATPGTPILRDGREVGVLYTQSGGYGIAYLRFDRIGEGMLAGDARVSDAE